MPCARPAAESSFRGVFGGDPGVGIASTALSDSFMNATLSAGPFKDCPVNAIIRETRALALRPLVIGWSASDLSSRLYLMKP